MQVHENTIYELDICYLKIRWCIRRIHHLIDDTLQIGIFIYRISLIRQS